MKLNDVNFKVVDTFSLFEKAQDGTVLSVVKKSEKEDKLIIRFFNPSRETAVEDSIKFVGKEVTSLAVTNLNEVEEEIVDYNSDANLGEFKACEVKTFAVEIK
jgi:mannosylglycerate hydrolase